MAKKNGSTTETEGKPFVVITLRIDPGAKKKLHAYCLARSRVTGKRVSYNQAIIEMIEAARANKQRAKPSVAA